MKVLVTGGSGFVGTNLQEIKPKWIYLSSKDCNLLSLKSCEEIIKKHQPDAIIHLAALVGGIKNNVERQAEYFYNNVKINLNIVEAAKNYKVKRVLCSLSTCAFPDKVEKYPFTEKDILSGPPAETNFSYGYAKRMLHIQCSSYRRQYGLNYSTFCPCNLYGPWDHFDTENSHFIAALLTKIFSSVSYDNIELWGTGKPLRQYLYVKDLCRILPILLKKHNSNIPLIVAPEENYSIKEITDKIFKILNIKNKYNFNGKLDGQFRKDGSNKELMKIIKPFKFTSFEKGIEETIKHIETKGFSKF